MTLSSNRLLIVGCGYLGRRVARRWVAQGGEVCALTRSAEHAEQFRQEQITPIVGDVTSAESLAALPAADTVLYAVGLDRRSGQSQRDVYVTGLGNVLATMQGRFRRLIYISSTSVYGQTDGQWVDESSDCRPDSPNGQVCLEAERLLRGHAPDANILRLAGIYGPRRLLARVEALRVGILPEGNPDAWLNLIHVDDAVSAVLACHRRGAPGAAYIVSDGHPCRRREYYSLLAALVGVPLPPSAWEQKTHGDETGPGAADKKNLNKENLNKRCSNRRLREELQVVLRYPKMSIGLPDALTVLL